MIKYLKITVSLSMFIIKKGLPMKWFYTIIAKRVWKHVLREIVRDFVEKTDNPYDDKLVEILDVLFN